RITTLHVNAHDILTRPDVVVAKIAKALRDAPERDPMIEVYFTAADGTKYRLYDTTFSGGKHHQRPIGDPTATARIFVPKDRTEMRRSYTFKPRDSRILEEQTLERQLRESGYVAREKFDASRHSAC